MARDVFGDMMGTCELCGTDKVVVNRAKTSGAVVDVCRKCIDRLGLTTMTPIKSIDSRQISALNNQKPNLPGRDIMAKNQKELALDFGHRIRSAREKRDWDQREFARRMNERLNSVQRVENGNRPSDALIKKIEKVLSIELFIDVQVNETRQVTGTGFRSMTIGDLYDDLLSRRD